VKLLNQYIPIAVDTVEDLFFTENGRVAPEYDNQVSRFGVALRQLGLRTTIAAFSTDSGSSEVSRIKISQAIHRIIEIHENGVCSPNDTLLDGFSRTTNERLLKRKINDAAIALKLALRVFIEEDKPKPAEEESDD